jgi:predicted aldo/keto reductase-like oxidoreductase
VEGGINYFDTGYIYPGSEEALGLALERQKLRDRVYIADKLPVILLKEREDFDRIFTRQLERLRTGHIDYYLMHMLSDLASWERLCSWRIGEWIDKRRRAGDIRRVGFSFHGSGEEFLRILDARDWDFCQIQYNYSDENYQAGVRGLRKAAERMPVIIMEPLLGGKLAGGLPRGAAEIFKKADPGLSPAARGLNWVWNQGEPTVVLSGMGEMAWLEENLRLAGRAEPGMLGEADQEIYRQALEQLNKSYRIRCTGCAYCLPCPRRVNIPGCFAAYNASFARGYVQGMKQYVTSTGAASIQPGGAGLCVKCGNCEGLCPQGLPIIKSLAKVRKRMEPLWFRGGLALVRRFLGKNPRG